MNVNKKVAISPVTAMAFEKFLYGQMQNFLHKLRMIKWNVLDVKMNELFLPAALASQVLYLWRSLLRCGKS